jgi:transposase
MGAAPAPDGQRGGQGDGRKAPVNKIHRAIRTAGARLLFLPPYSPDFNPIEQALAKLRALLRKAEERTLEALWRRIGSLLDAFSPAECTNYFRNCGHGST